MKFTFAPGALAQLESDLDPNELEEFLTSLAESFTSGAMLEQATEIDMSELIVTDPELYNHIQQVLEEFDQTPNPHTLH